MKNIFVASIVCSALLGVSQLSLAQSANTTPGYQPLVNVWNNSGQVAHYYYYSDKGTTILKINPGQEKKIKHKSTLFFEAGNSGEFSRFTLPSTNFYKNKLPPRAVVGGTCDKMPVVLEIENLNHYYAGGNGYFVLEGYYDKKQDPDSMHKYLPIKGQLVG